MPLMIPLGDELFHFHIFQLISRIAKNILERFVAYNNRTLPVNHKNPFLTCLKYGMIGSF
jgi:hypothetical protein